MDLVSVIVPVYNVENYIDECIESLVNQTYERIEIILVDDGSKDSSGNKCDMAGKKDSRIKVIHKKNAGLGYARNSGLEVARGKYVTFIDSDDKADSDLISRLMEPVIADKVDTCIGGFKRISEAGELEYEEKYDVAIYQGEDVYTCLFARMLGSAAERHDAVRMSVWNVLYSMDIIRGHDVKFPSEREFISEDIIWDSEYYRYSKKAIVIDSTAYNYRITPGSLTQKYKKNRFEMVCILYNEMCKRINYDENMKTRLQRQFFVNLRVCLRQEKQCISNYSRKEYRRNIKKILNDDTVQNVLREYPIGTIQFKQRLFLLLVKYKMVDLIIIFNDRGII